jgi:hypothetical protein
MAESVHFCTRIRGYGLPTCFPKPDPTWHRCVGRKGHRHRSLNRIGKRARGSGVWIRGRSAAAAPPLSARHVGRRRAGRWVGLAGGPGRLGGGRRRGLLLMMSGSGRRRVNCHPGEAGGEILHNRGGSQERFSKPVLRIRYVIQIPDQKTCAADFSLLNLPKGKSLGRSKPATNSN